MRWAEAPYERHQLNLISPSIDEMIGADHEIRLFEALLQRLDWGSWEERYNGRRGQPPIHPRLVAGSMLWGLLRGIRSSRHLEDATRHRTDFIWFLSGRTIDHSTFANFRNEFEVPLRGLSAELRKQAQAALGGKLATVAVDGTLIRANSDWRGSKTADALSRMLEQLGIEIDDLLAEMRDADATAEENERLKRRLAAMEAQQAKLKRALSTARKRDKRKGKKSRKTRIPVTDPDATLRKNKEGGHAPNHAPVAAVDVDSGVIVHAEVLHEKSEAKSLSDVVDSCENELGKAPEKVVADGNFACGKTFKSLDERGVETYVPIQDFNGAELAERPDPSIGLSEARLQQLPLRNERFSRAAFLYDGDSDCVYCPAGQTMTLYRTLSNSGRNPDLVKKEYRTKACLTCPLAARCVNKGCKQRTISQDELAHLREASARRLRTDAGKALYRTRAPAIEGVFATVKHAMGIRRFLTRGHQKVETEWLWICTAFNLRKLLKKLAENPPFSAVAPIINPLRAVFALIAPRTHRTAGKPTFGLLCHNLR